jgi:lysophospholipase L1-like esterase
MKNQILFILLILMSVSGYSQTYDALPAGSKPYGNQLFITPAGSVIAGTSNGKYRTIATNQKVDSLLTTNFYSKTVTDSKYFKYSDSAAFSAKNTLQKITSNGNVTSNNLTLRSFKSGLVLDSATTYYRKLVVIGNSITFGVGASPRSIYNWPTIVSTGTGSEVTNFGIPGTTLVKFANGDSSAIDRLTRIIPKYTSSSVGLVSEYGTNDAANVGGTFNEANFRSAYNVLIDTAVARGWPLNKIILFIPYNTRTRIITSFNINEIVRNISALKGVTFADTYTSMLNNGAASLLAPDGLHPNNKGYGVIGEAILAVMSGAKYDYSNVNHDLLVGGRVYTGKGLYGGGNSNAGLELHGNDNNGQSAITAFDNFYIKKNLVFNSSGGPVTTPYALSLGGQYVTGSITENNLKLVLYQGTGFGVSGTEGLGIFSSSGPTGNGRITSYQNHYFKGNISLSQSGGAVSTPSYIDFGQGTYATGSATYANAMLKFYNGTYIGVSNTDGLTFGSSAGATPIISFKNNSRFALGLSTLAGNIDVGTSTGGIQTTPPYFSSNSYANAAGTTSNTQYKVFGGSGMGANATEGLFFLAGNGLVARISLKNDTYVAGDISNTGNHVLGSSESGGATTNPKNLMFGSGYSAVPAVGLKVKLFGNTENFGFGVSLNSLDYVSTLKHSFYLNNTTSDVIEKWKITNIGLTNIISGAQSAQIHLLPQTTNGTAPLKFTSGSLLASPEPGALEYDGSRLYITSTSARNTLAYLSDIAAPDTTTTAFRTKANSLTLAQAQTKDAQNLKLTGNQTVSGTKIFSAITKFPVGAEFGSPTGNSLMLTDNVIVVQNSSAAFAQVLQQKSGIISLTSDIPQVLSATSTLDFTTVNPGSSLELSISVSGVAAGDVMALGKGQAYAGLIYDVYATSNGSVNISVTNISSVAIDPPATVFKVKVFK